MRPVDNPFRAECLQDISYIFQDGGMAAFFRRLHSVGERAAIVGARGTGKTTLLNSIDAAFAENGRATCRIFVNEGNRHEVVGDIKSLLEKVRTDEVVLLDGAEQLSWWQWKRFLFYSRHAAGLLITCHHAGRLPCILQTTGSPELLDELVNMLTGREVRVTDVFSTVLYQKHEGNIREALRELYDIYSRF